MKNFSLIIIAILAINITSIAQEKESKTEKIEIKTSAVCSMCKERIEHDMAFEKSVKSVELNLKTKIVTIEYRRDKTDPEKLRKAISAIGYDADNVEADPKAYEKLPACCKKDAPPH
ncbi:MAG: cation transporter [Bacteroidetes bacterium]|nr:cation transporter [Bacteroidota bacterium]